MFVLSAVGYDHRPRKYAFSMRYITNPFQASVLDHYGVLEETPGQITACELLHKCTCLYNLKIRCYAVLLGASLRVDHFVCVRRQLTFLKKMTKVITFLISSAHFNSIFQNPAIFCQTLGRRLTITCPTEKLWQASCDVIPSAKLDSKSR